MKILVLHGYTQSGPGFQRKIQKLQRHLESTFTGTEFYFLTGPIRLRPSDKVTVPSRWQHNADTIAEVQKSLPNIPDPDDIDAYAWFVLHDFRDPPMGFEKSLAALAEVLRTKGPFDGILGFSQGGLLAVMIASLLEGSVRRDAFARAEEQPAEALPFLEPFKKLDHPPLKFGIVYGAMMAMGNKYAAFYEKPRIQTPFIRFSGLWDPMVSAEMVRAVENTDMGGIRSVTIVHPGAHIVPLDGRYLDNVVDFIKSLGCNSLSQEPRTILEPQYTLYTSKQLIDLKNNDAKISTKELRSDSTESTSEGSHRTFGHVRSRRLGRNIKRKRVETVVLRVRLELQFQSSETATGVSL